MRGMRIVGGLLIWVGQAAAAPTAPPAMDGVKETTWGTAIASSVAQSRSPGDYLTVLHALVDSQYLYIGWSPVVTDPWGETPTGKSAHYVLLVDTDNGSYGGSSDPWQGGATFPLTRKPNFSLNGYVGAHLGAGANAFGVAPTLHRWTGAAWSGSAIGSGDYATSVPNDWNELRLPLSTLNLAQETTAYFVLYFRPAEDKPGITDSVFYDPAAASDFGDGAAAISASSVTVQFLIRDSIAPAAISNLTALRGANPGELRLTWTAPGHDGNGAALVGAYRIIRSTLQIGALEYASALPLGATAVLVSTNTPAGGSQEYVVTGLTNNTTFYFAVIAQDGAANGSTWATGTGTDGVNDVNWNYPRANSPPTVTVTLPDGGEAWTGSQTVTWSGSDPDGDALTFTLADSSDSGTTWATVASALTGTSYVWATSSRPNGTRHRVRITAADPAGATGQDTSNADFTLLNGIAMDGTLASAWGSRVATSGGQQKQPTGSATDLADLYVTNDRTYLYLGWTPVVVDPWNDNLSAHYVVTLETNTTGGFTYDPWKASTNFTWANQPDVSVNGYVNMNTSTNTFGGVSVHNAQGANTVQSTTTLPTSDWATSVGNNWNEMRIRISSLNVTNGTTVYVMVHFRPDENKVGLSDSILYDAAASDWSDGAATLSASSSTVGYVMALPAADTTPPAAISNLTALTGPVSGSVRLAWTAPGDDGASGALTGLFRIRYSTVGNIPDFNGPPNPWSQVEVTTSGVAAGSAREYVVESLTPGKTYWFAMVAQDDVSNVGSWSTSGVNTANSASARQDKRAIDGSAADWVGTAPTRDNAAAVSSEEWIWRDKTNDQRGDAATTSGSSDFDLKELRLTADDVNLYVLAKFRDITNPDWTYLGISVDTNSASATGISDGAHFNADDGGVLPGGEYGNLAANQTWPEKVVIIHNAQSGAPWIEIYPDPANPTLWFTPPGASPGSGAAAVSAANDAVECRIPRVDLGLDGVKTARIRVGVYQNVTPVGYANDQDTTRNFSSGDALDAMSIARMSTGTAAGQWRNDPLGTMSAWEEELSDGDLDFWADVRIGSTGSITNVAPTTPASPNLNGATTTTLTPTLSWGVSTDADAGDAVTSYLLEAHPVNDFTGSVAWRVNVAGNSWAVPSEGLNDQTTYYWQVAARDRTGALSSFSAVWSFFVNATTTPATVTVSPFTPVIDAAKDSGWGANPTAASSGAKRPWEVASTTDNPRNHPVTVDNIPADGQGLARDVYMTNDAAYLYLGWQAWGDPYRLETDGLTQAAAQYGFALETKRDTAGTPQDPWQSNTKLDWVMQPDVWVNGAVDFTSDLWTLMTRYLSNGQGGWDGGTDLSQGTDYQVAMSSQWGELRLSLKLLGLKRGRLVNLIHVARHSARKPGLSDTSPYVATGTTDWADVAAVIPATAAVTYAIQYAKVSAEHVPSSTPVTGFPTMRSPVTPPSSQGPAVTLAAQPVGLLDTASVVYSTTSFTTTVSAAFGAARVAGSREYRDAAIGAFPRGTTVYYYLSVEANGMVTYVYGSDLISNTTSLLATATSNAYQYVVANTTPTPPTSATISPALPSDSADLTCAASGGSDADGDALTYVFEWTRNGLFHSSTTDTSAPYTATISSTVTSPGDDWACRVSARDPAGAESAPRASQTVTILLRDWTGTAPAEVNVATVSAGEWIFRDKSGDRRNESTPAPLSNYDVTEIRLAADGTDLYLLARFADLTSTDEPALAVSLDTNSSVGTGGSVLGDDGNLVLGGGYLAPAASHYWEHHLLFHATAPGAFTLEVSSTGGWGAAPSGSVVTVSLGSDLVEARIPRPALGLSGTPPARLAAAVFANVPGRAASQDTSRGFTGTDALDSLAVVRLSTGSSAGQYLNDPANGRTAWEEDLSDGAADFWTQVPFTASGVGTNTAPAPPATPSPASGATTGQQPTLSWAAASDPDAGDQVASYLLEVATAADVSGGFAWRVNVAAASFGIPEPLTNRTTYYWRVRARDLPGTLSSAGGPWSFFVSTSVPVVSLVRDDLASTNVSNLGAVDGVEDADGTVTWVWTSGQDPGGGAIDQYAIEVATLTGFSPVFASATVTAPETRWTRSGLTRGFAYYARARARTSAGVWGPFSAPTDGIYVSVRQLDGSRADWGAATLPANATGTATGAGGWPEAIWRDGGSDQRTDKPNSSQLDLSTLAITCDRYNLYGYVVFGSTVSAGYDGRHYLQLAVDNGRDGSHRAFVGTNTFVAAGAQWEWLIRVLSGNDRCEAVDRPDGLNQTVQAGGYAKDVPANTIEFLVPLARLGGAERFLGRTVNLTCAVFENVGGQPALYGSGSAAVDAMCRKATADEVSDTSVDFYLALALDGEGRPVAITPTEPPFIAPPPQAAADGSVPASVRDSILYSVFQDRFLDGNPGNQPADSLMTGGDFRGLITTMTYLNELGCNTLFLSPVCEFGGGVWGYNQNDLYKIQSSYTDDPTKLNGFPTFVEMAKAARRRNIRLVMDWVPGQVYDGRTVTNHPDWFSDQVLFGGKFRQHTFAEVEQSYVDQARFWRGLGVVGFRVDNPKFWASSADNGSPRGYDTWRYFRKKVNRFDPAFYTFGEIPDSPATIGSYVYLGDMLVGAIDFGSYWNGGLQAWAQGNKGSDAFRTDLDGVENAYGGVAVMAGYLGNHDHDRLYHELGHDIWNSQVAHLFGYTYVDPPVLFYGNERGMEGHNIGQTNQATVTNPMPWDYSSPDLPAGAANSGVLDRAVRRMGQARAIFPALRTDRNGRYYILANGAAGSPSNALVYARRSGSQKIVAALNPTNTDHVYAIPSGDPTTDAQGTAYRDWQTDEEFTVNASGNITLSGGGNVTVGSNSGRLLVRGGYGLATLTGNLGVKGAVVSVDDHAAWTRETGGSGAYTISRIVTPRNGSVTRKVTYWAPGKGLLEETTTFTDGGTVTRSPALGADGAAPSAPTGLSAQPRRGAVDLSWDPNPETDVESYRILRSRIPGDPNPALVMDCVGTVFYDHDLDRGLTNGATYYYRLKAADRAGNESGYSAEVAVSPHPVNVTFWLDTRGYGGSITSVKLGANSTVLGRSSTARVWPSPIALQDNGNGSRQVTLALDPGLWVEYKYLINDGWEPDVPNNLVGNPNRLSEVTDGGTGRMLVANQWAVNGDAAPAAPAGLVTTPRNGEIRLGWTSNIEPDVSYYTVSRGTDGAALARVTDVGGALNFYHDTGLTNGTTYYYRLTATDGVGQASGASAVVSTAPVSGADTTSPAAPAGLRALAAGLDGVEVLWNFNREGDLLGYRVSYATASGGPYALRTQTLVAPTTAPRYTDAGPLASGTTHYYRVTAEDESGNASSPGSLGAYLTNVTFQVDLGPVLAADARATGSPKPLDTAGASLTKAAASNTWSGPVGLIGGQQVRYRYQYTAGGQTVQEQEFGTASRDREMTVPFAAATTLNDDWEEAPAAVTNPLAAAGDKQVILSWDANKTAEDLSGYTVYQSGSVSGPFTRVNASPVAAARYTVTGLTNGAVYYFLVRAVDGGTILLESADSPVVSARPDNPVIFFFKGAAPRRPPWRG